MTLPLLIAIATLIALSTMSVVTGYRLAGRRVLPMQWDFGGRPVWTAPRNVALAFTPALAATILTVILFPAITGPLTTSAWYCGTVILVCAVFVVIHGAYLGMVSRPVTAALAPVRPGGLRN